MSADSADNRSMFGRRVQRHAYLIISFALTLVVITTYRPGSAAARIGTDVLPVVPSASPAPVMNGVLETVEARVPFGGTLADALEAIGMESAAAFEVTKSLGGVLDMTRIPADQLVQVDLADGRPTEVRVPLRYDRVVVATNQDAVWSTVVQRPTIIAVPRIVKAEVDSSLYATARREGIPLSVMMRAIELFSFEVDFQRDIQPGNRIVVLYEDIRDQKGTTVAAGPLIHASLQTGGRRIEAWRYERLDGTVEYYGQDGNSVRKALLKTPVDGARISSSFGLRHHPILGYTALHRGIDFAVPLGTPVKAAGDGVVVQAGWHDQYGWRVKLRHGNQYDTMYAHFSRIAPGIGPGMEIRQGTVVGYVGSTGMSTGPHCHYEVHYAGSPVNPSTLKFPPGHRLEDEDLRLFRLVRLSLLSEFDLD